MFYTVNKSSRWFKPGSLYTDIDWRSLEAVADAFLERMEEWYIKPAEALRTSGHFAFAAMALNCILIDTLSQYHYGRLHSSASTFKDFVRDALPEFRRSLPSPVRHFDSRTGKVRKLAVYADVLYYAFRCGIVHEAHVAPYGMVHAGAGVVFAEPSGRVHYTSDGAACPSVIVDPWELLERVKVLVASYIRDLKDPDPRFDELRACFKDKFTGAFGVDILGAS